MNTHPLKVWRDKNELSQEAAAERLQVKPMTVSRWERGNHLPNKRQWPVIERVTGITAAELAEHVKTAEAVQ